MNPAAAYWERGLASVPHVTGAARLLDAHDVPELAAALGFGLPFGRVLDVGCGTGRIATHCRDYVGVDISRDAVAYCRRAGLKALVIEDERDLSQRFLDPFDLVACLSVFTHIDATARRRYLACFAKLAPQLLVDIIPGDGSGGVPAWTAIPSEFERQVEASGYRIRATTDRTETDWTHRYYWAELT